MNKRAGFSLVELMVAALAGSVLAITAGTLLVMAFGAWQRNHTAVNLQRDCTAAMDMMRRAVRNTTLSLVTVATTNELRILQVAGGPAVRFYRNGQQLVYDPNTTVNGDQITLVTAGLQGFRARQVDNGVDLLLVVDDGQSQLAVDAVAAHRN